LIFLHKLKRYFGATVLPRISTALSISLQIVHQRFERNDGPSRGRFAWADRSQRQPPFPNAYGVQVVVAQ
jgi:hypothetical protein